MDEEEITRRLTKLDQLMNKLIFAFMQGGMSYRQAEEEMFRRLEKKDFPRKRKTIEDCLTNTLSPFECIFSRLQLNLLFQTNPLLRDDDQGRIHKEAHQGQSDHE
jgi:hypothetical protein